MRFMEKEELQALMQHASPWSVSILMPTHRMGQEIRQDPIRLKNLIGQAEGQMVAAGVRPAEVRDRLEPLRHLVDDGGFWRTQEEGLAIYHDGLGPPRIYRVPQALSEMVLVTGRFYLKPLLPIALDDTRFYVLALSESTVQLYHCTRLDMTPEEVPDVPHSIDELMKYIDDEKQMQWHTRTSVAGSPRLAVPQARRRGQISFGMGSSADKAVDKKWMLEYCRLIDHGVTRHLAAHHEPLLVAAAEPTWAIYQQANRYAHLVGKPIHGNPDRVDLRDLHRQAAALVRPAALQRCRRAIAAYLQFEGTDRVANDVERVVQAACDGQIDSVVLSLDDEVWGRYDSGSGRVAVHTQREGGDQDLLDLAAVQSYLHGGAVYLVKRDQIPGGTPAAAVLRYPR